MTTNRRRWTPLAVAGALLLVYLLLIPVAQVSLMLRHDIGTALIVPAVTLLIAHWSLYAGWAVLGDGPWMPRFAATIFGLVAPTIAFEWIVPGSPLSLLLLLALAYASLVALPLAVARASGYRCRLPDEFPDTISTRQFSLGQIFALTTIVAAMMTLVRLIGPLDTSFDVPQLILIFLSPAVIIWGAFPLMLASRQPQGSLGVLLLSGVVGGLLRLIIPRFGPPLMIGSITLGLMLTLGVILILSLGALRLSGYRLTAQAVTTDPHVS